MAKQVFQVVGVGDTGPHGAPVTVLTAQVDLDLHTEQAARDELARLHTGAGPVVVDASAVFVAVAGLRLLLSCVEQLRRSGRPAELVVSRHLRRVARVVGQEPGELRLTVPDALAHLGGAGHGAVGEDGRSRAGTATEPGGDRDG
jgi:anti-anti-sigma regulatory factor